MITRIALLLWIGLVVVLQSPVAFAQNTVPPIPDEVKTFYRDRNTVAALSLPRERIALAGMVRPDTLSQRLRLIYGMMAVLEEMELDPDPHMLMPGLALRVTVPAALAEVTDMAHPQPGVMEVHVLVRDLAMQDNFLLIETYESGKIPPATHLFEYSPVSSREIHTWRRIGGRWLREPSGLTLLSDH